MGNTPNKKSKSDIDSQLDDDFYDSPRSSPSKPKRSFYESPGTKSKSSPSRSTSLKGSNKDCSLVFLLEEILKFSPFLGSQQYRPYAFKTIRDIHDPLSLFTIDNFNDLILHIVESPRGQYFHHSEEKVPYLYQAYLRAYSTETTQNLSIDDKREIMKILLSYFTSLVTSPEVFDSEFEPEDLYCASDISCKAKTEFYKLLTAGINKTFFYQFVRSLSEDDLALVFHPILKRILKDTCVNDLYHAGEAVKALQLLKFLITFSKYLLRYFYKSSLFIPFPDPSTGKLTGQYFQRNSILASALSITSLPDDNTHYMSYFVSCSQLDQCEKYVMEVREKIKDVIDLVYDILDYMIKREERGRKAVLAWIYKAIELNNAKQKLYNTNSACSSEGFLANFLYLLLKISKPLLDEIKDVGDLDKIDPLYLREKEIFNHLSLMNGNSNFYFPSNPEEAKQSAPILQDSPFSQKQTQSPQEVSNQPEEDPADQQAESVSVGNISREDLSDNEENSRIVIRKLELEEEKKDEVQDELLNCIETKEVPMDSSIQPLVNENNESENQIDLGSNSKPQQEFAEITTEKVPSMRSDLETSNLFEEYKERFSTPSPAKKKGEEGFNFLTEVLFLANHTLRLVHSQYQKYYKLIHRMEKENSVEYLFNSYYLKKRSKKQAYDVHYTDPELWDNLCRLFEVNVLFITHNRGIPIKSVLNPSEVLSLYNDEPKTHSETYGMVPVYWAENLVQFPQILVEVKSQLILKNLGSFKMIANFMVVAMGEKNWIGNPYLKIDYLNFLNSMLPDIPSNHSMFLERDPEISRVLLEENAFFEEEITANLMSFFWAMDKANATHEFEKYNYRHWFCKLLNRLAGYVSSYYTSQKVRECLKKAIENQDDFRRLCCLLLNDMMILLDDSLSKLETIKKHQDTVQLNPPNFLSFQERAEQDALCQQYLQIVNVSAKFLNQYFGFLLTLANVNPQCFLLDEQLLQRLINNCNYTVSQLFNPNAVIPTVQRMRELKFDTREMLRLICFLLLKYQASEVFLRFTVADERNYSLKCHQDAVLYLLKEKLLNEDDIYQIQVMMEKWKIFTKEKKLDDEFFNDLGEEIPEDFIDPIMGHVMKNPVLLSTSNVIVDKSTIMRHLMTDKTDPFNRKELSKDMLFDQPELREKIQSFLTEKRKVWEGKRKEKQGSDNHEKEMY